MTCTAECLDKQMEREREHSAFLDKFPLYCRMCGGSGLEVWLEDQSPFGSGVSMMMEMDDICSACVGIDVCSMCANDLDEHGECPNVECPFMQEPDQLGNWECAPPPHECMCWYKHDLDWARGTDGGER